MVNRKLEPIPLGLTPEKEDARQADRVEIPGRAFVHDETRLYIAPLRNISAGGVFIDHVVSIPVGADVKLVLKSRDLPRTVQVRGNVIRIETGPRMGIAVKFTEVASDMRELIQNYVLEKTRSEFMKRQAGIKFQIL